MAGSGSWDAADTSSLDSGDAYGLDAYAEAQPAEYDPFESPDYVDSSSVSNFASLKESRESRRGSPGAGMEAVLGVDAAMAAAVANATRPKQEEFLSYDKRGVFERATYATGLCYSSGIILGGARGFFSGLANSPSPRFRVRVNAVLNGCGRGARLGNTLGVVAMFFTCFEWAYDQAEVDKLARMPGSDWLSPVMASASTGLMYRITKGPQTAALSAVVGGLMGAAWFIGMPKLMYEYPQIGDLLPGRR